MCSFKKEASNLPRLVPVLLFLFSIEINGQSSDYSEIFGKDWQKAEQFISANEVWMKSAAGRMGISYHEAEAIVFPELIRYSALRDKIEITLLKALYVNLGEEYADFSIGPFQVKPTFAEKVRLYSERVPGRKIKSLFRYDYETGNIRSLRALIVSELEDPVSEWNYILAFLAICEKRFDLKSMDREKRIVFLATAYNYGFFRKQEEITGMQGRRYFCTSLISTNSYSYSEIALFWYNRELNKK
jgi:hypothetical protein